MSMNAGKGEVVDLLTLANEMLPRCVEEILHKVEKYPEYEVTPPARWYNTRSTLHGGVSLTL
jgi:hypothetical protein